MFDETSLTGSLLVTLDIRIIITVVAKLTRRLTLQLLCREMNFWKNKKKKMVKMDTVTPFWLKCYTLLFFSLSCSALSHARQSHANPYFIGWSDKSGVRVNFNFFPTLLRMNFPFEIQIPFFFK